MKELAGFPFDDSRIYTNEEMRERRVFIDSQGLPAITQQTGWTTIGLQDGTVKKVAVYEKKRYGGPLKAAPKEDYIEADRRVIKEWGKVDRTPHSEEEVLPGVIMGEDGRFMVVLAILV